MNEQSARPMVALRLKKKPIRGGRKGQVTTKPKDIDEVIRQEYGKVHNCNVIDIQKTTDEHLVEYDDYIYKAKGAVMQELEGEERKQLQRKTRVQHRG